MATTYDANIIEAQSMATTYDANIIEAQWHHMKTHFLRVMQVPAYGEVYRLRLYRMIKMLSQFVNDLSFMIKDCAFWREIDRLCNVPEDKSVRLNTMRIRMVFDFAMDAIRVIHNIHDRLAIAISGNPNLAVVVSQKGQMAHECDFKGSPIYLSFVQRAVTHN